MNDFESAQSLLFRAGYELVFILAVFDGTSLARNVLVDREKLAEEGRLAVFWHRWPSTE